MASRLDIMEGAVRARMRSQRGASIIIALFFLMVCAIVAATVVGYASANADRSAQHVKEQKAYYALSSAVEESKSMFITDTKYQLNTLSVAFPGGSATGMQVTPGTYSSNDIATWVIQQAVNVQSGNATSSQTFTISGKNQDTGESLPDVTLKYTMNANYDITITGTVGDGSDYGYTLTTSIIAVPAKDSVTNKIIKVTWGGVQS